MRGRCWGDIYFACLCSNNFLFLGLSDKLILIGQVISGSSAHQIKQTPEPHYRAVEFKALVRGSGTHIWTCFR